MNHLADRDIDFFNIDPEVLPGETYALYLFILFQGYMLRTSVDLIKENSFTFLKKARSRRYSAKAMTDVD